MNIIAVILVLGLAFGAFWYLKNKNTPPPTGGSPGGSNSGPLLALLLTFALFASSVPAFAAPTSGSAQIGQKVTLSVTVNGTAPFTYQWVKDGVLIPAPAGTQATYVIASSVQSDAGTYKVVVGNPAGTATSNDGVLTITLIPPSIPNGPTFTVN